MKTVVSPSEVAHFWANQTQSNARSSNSSLYFNDKSIYSWGRHFVIAKHITEFGIDAVLFTERRYSRSTANHISIVYQACNHLNVIYCPDPANSHTANFNSWVEELEECGNRVVNAKKPEVYLLQIDRIKERISKYTEFFQIEITEVIKSLTEINEKSDFEGYFKNRRELQRLDLLRIEKEQKRRHKVELKKWFNFESSRLYTRDGFDYLRLKEDVIETSQGIKVPLKVGKGIYNKLISNEIKKDDEILDFRVKKITTKVFQVGCHNFDRKYLLQFGKTL